MGKDCSKNSRMRLTILQASLSRFLYFGYLHLPHINIAPLKTKWWPTVSYNSINKICIAKHHHLQVPLLGVFGQKIITMKCCFVDF